MEKEDGKFLGYLLDQDQPGWIVSCVSDHRYFLVHAYRDVIGDSESPFEASCFPTEKLAHAAIALHRESRGTPETVYQIIPVESPPSRAFMQFMNS